MDDLPDFTHYGYSLQKELGANRSGGRITYLAIEIEKQRTVVIKQFQFAKTSSSWSAYDAHQREIEVLKGLQHSGIPAYLNSFQLPDGFCMVQEYKQAQPLSVNRSFSGEDIGAIATQTLEILIYLQNRIPPIIHRDLKPDNILVDDKLNVYLVDFGFARVGDGEVGVSSVVKGTLGFMPPEQLFNRQLTEASDLYGLGMTLICLLTQTKPDDIGSLVDISYKIKFRHLAPKLSLPWVKWLEKMAEPRVKDRYPNAREALKSLPTASIHPPEVQMSQANFTIQANRIGEVITRTVDVTNVVPEILLSGHWEVQKHPQDPKMPNGNHAWLEITPSTFEGNRVPCQISIDTRKLMAGETYQRTLLLHTNAFPQTYSIPLQVQTASIPVQNSSVSFYPILALFFFVLMACRILLWAALPASLLPQAVGVTSFGLLLGTVGGLQGSAWTLQGARIYLGSQLASFLSIFLAAATLTGVGMVIDGLAGSWDTILAGLIPGTIGGWLLGLGLGLTTEKLLEAHVPKAEAIALALTTLFLALAVALGLLLGFGQWQILLPLTVSAMVLGSLLVHAPLKRAKRIAAYRQMERNHIRPRN
ncbi:serine/threonine-protein kinase [Oscillatoria sp. CS-180]|uniref:serine/threonine protein kinase n=1 Tax=Oscillatoria sp. CS-180 TaxID=3021720 RepID=UPI00232D6A28|nr:serine/threonine-protein kinase [Oscillatoria sp. CS-180]MDB9527493.1 serine/threonine-protein kinase [Oscillatoria sp. CS-180]